MAEARSGVSVEAVAVELTPPFPGAGREEGYTDPEATICLSPPSMAPDRLWLMEVGSGRRYQVESFPWEVGRDEGADLTLSGDLTVSRRHARFQRRPGGIVIEDLESASGIRVNGHPVQEVLLAHQDVVTLGATTLVVHFVGPEGEGSSGGSPRSPGRGGRWKMVALLTLGLPIAAALAYLALSLSSSPAGGEGRVSAGLPDERTSETAEAHATPPPIQDSAPVVEEPAPDAPHREVDVAPPAHPAAGRSVRRPPRSVGVQPQRQRPASPPPVKVTMLDGDRRLERAKSRYLDGAYEEARRMLDEVVGSNRYPARDRSRARRVREDLERLATAYRTGLASWDAGRVEEGFEAWVGFLRSEARILPGRHSRWAKEVRERVVAELSRRGRQASEAGREHDAYRYWLQAERIDPESEGAHLRAEREREAQALYRRGYRQETVNLKRALEYWNQVVRLVPPDSEYHIKAAAKIRWYAYLEE